MGLTESGIYELWYQLIADFESHRFPSSLKSDYKPLEIERLEGVVIVVILFVPCIMLVFVYEKLSYKKVDRRRRAFYRRLGESFMNHDS